MHIEKLNKSNFTSSRNTRNVSTISFNKKGVVHLSRNAVRQLRLYDTGKKKFFAVSVFIDKDDHMASNFFIMRDDSSEGWCLRKAYGGGAVFNSCELSRYVIRKTWERTRHVVGDENVPDKMIFRIASLPVDDEENKNVYALLRKKDV